MSFISRNMGQFAYFNALLNHPTWEGKTVLDFGGNAGNMLLDPDSTIEHDRYWCIDVSKDAIELGLQRYPQANFVFHDCYNFEFNPFGVRNLPLPELETEFDFILAVSVFGTNTPRAEMLTTAAELSGWLSDDGVLAFTFIDPHHIPVDAELSNLQHFLEDGFDRLDENQKRASWYTIKDDDIWVESDARGQYEDSEGHWFLALYTADYMRFLFPDAEILPPVRPLAKHHCCVIRGKKTTSYVSKVTGHFAYFDAQLARPAWKGKRVLDFGGNIGNTLLDPESTIEHDKYWCIDVSRDALETGRKMFPDAKFIFYDGYDFEFNPTGKRDLPLPELGVQFDYILSVAVFGTNTPKGQMLDLVDRLKRWLSPDGVLAFTFLDPHHVPVGSTATNLQFYLEDGFGRLDERQTHGSWYTIKNDDVYVESDALNTYEDCEGSGFLALYSVDYMKSLLPEAQIMTPVHPFPKSHCCIIRGKNSV